MSDSDSESGSDPVREITVSKNDCVGFIVGEWLKTENMSVFITADNFNEKLNEMKEKLCALDVDFLQGMFRNYSEVGPFAEINIIV
ncbi:hypothetical protein OAG24_01125 [bacterium]|nr:hypothetical protein [bacterium]